MKNKIRVGFVGCGHMASAIIKSMTDVASRAAFKANGDVIRLTVADRHEAKLMPFRERCAVTLDPAEAVRSSDYVFIAVKPQSAGEALGSLDLSQKVVISIMAGYSLARIRELTGAKKIVRVMPNLNAAAGESYSAFAWCGLDGEEQRVVRALLGSFGLFRETDERDFDAVTGIAGSGPAFVFMTIKAFYDEAVARGLDEATAKEMAVQTFIGSALTVERSRDDFDSLISSVCSKGGTTIEGVNYLKESGYESIVRTAISKSIEKSKEMSGL